MNILLILIGAIVVFSVMAFSQSTLLYRYQFNAYQIIHRKQYIRLISHGFLHGSWTHLLVNMFVLYSFGRAVIYHFNYAFPGRGTVMFLLLFFSSLIFSSLYSLLKKKTILIIMLLEHQELYQLLFLPQYFSVLTACCIYLW